MNSAPARLAAGGGSGVVGVGLWEENHHAPPHGRWRCDEAMMRISSLRNLWRLSIAGKDKLVYNIWLDT